MIYIASPYSSPVKTEREDRAFQAGAFAAHCALRGHQVYCPIASWHHLAQVHSLPGDFTFWRRLNFTFLRHAQELWVLKLEGWDKSVGVRAEIDMSMQLHITRRYFDGDNFQEEV